MREEGERERGEVREGGEGERDGPERERERGEAREGRR